MFVFLYVLRYRFFRVQRARAYKKTLRHTRIHVRLSRSSLWKSHVEVYTIFFIFVRISRRML